jgi:hypothetical protein
VRKLEPRKSTSSISEEHLIDHLVQMNIGEIRTRIHMHLIAPVVHAFAPDEHKHRVRNILTGLIADEVRHIAYTAKLLEAWASTGFSRTIKVLFEERLKEFDAITISQTEHAIRSFGRGEFPDLLEV